jgi:hypothetical protein
MAIGFDPLFDRPLRGEPVRRDEVSISGRRLETMPIATWRFEERQGQPRGLSYTARLLVGDAELWHALLDEIGIRVTPEFSVWEAREYVCEYCGVRYLGLKRGGDHRVRVCSNECARRRRNAKQRLWRQQRGPSDYQLINAARASMRAEARAGRSCARCGIPIKAARSTKRFCSDVCRVRAHRAAQARERRAAVAG